MSLVSLETRGTPIADQLAFLERFVFSGRAGIAILDLCCGHGRHLAGLARADRTLVGVDNNEYFLTVARASTGGDVELRNGDVTRDRFGTGFDFILCLENSFVFEEQDAHEVMERIASALAEGGVAVIHLSNPAYMSDNLPRRTWRKIGNRDFVLEDRVFRRGRCTITRRRFRKVPENRYEMDEARIGIFVRNLDQLSKLAGRSNLRLTQSFGSFSGDPYEEGSPDLICLFELPATASRTIAPD